MPKYTLGIVDNMCEVFLFDDSASDDISADVLLHFTAHNYFDENVELQVSIQQLSDSLYAHEHALKLVFIDVSTNETIYSVSGILSGDENLSGSIVSIMNAMADFDDSELLVVDELKNTTVNAEFYNKVNTLGRKKIQLNLPALPALPDVDVYNILTSQDDLASVMYMVLGDDISVLTEMIRVANRLNVRLWVELDPKLTLEQVLTIGAELQLFDHHVCLLWSPILARPLNAVGLKGKKVARYSGGVILGEYLKRQANTNTAGIPAIHRPVAGFDYPISFVGIEQNPSVVLDDPALKALANVYINVVKRERFPNGIRFILNDSLTAYGDNRSVLKLANASEISMFIDNRLIEICKRHLQKHIEGTIEDSLKESVRFLDACTSKDRPLLRKSSEIGGFYNLSITPRDDRPHDAIDLECAYHPQGTGRAIFLKTTVTA